MRGMFVRVTGGISLAVGSLCVLDVGAVAFAWRPVLMIGGCSSVDMAIPSMVNLDPS